MCKEQKMGNLFIVDGENCTDFKNESLLLTKDVQAICQPLFKEYGINGFSYSRVFPDGARSELWSNHHALYHTFIKKKYITNNYYSPNNYKKDEKYVFLANKIENCSLSMKERYTNQLTDLKQIFNYDNCFLIVNKTYLICEYFIFYTPSNFRSAYNFYINRLIELDNFSRLFKDKAKAIIKIADREKIINPWRKDVSINLSRHKNQILSLGKNVMLSKREFEVAQHIVKGKTAKESAMILNISTRTIEYYIDNININGNWYTNIILLVKRETYHI